MQKHANAISGDGAVVNENALYGNTKFRHAKLIGKSHIGTTEDPEAIKSMQTKSVQEA